MTSFCISAPPLPPPYVKTPIPNPFDRTPSFPEKSRERTTVSREREVALGFKTDARFSRVAFQLPDFNRSL